MRCIWTGDIKKLWSAVQLCCILEHLEHWFIQVYRPWVSGCLDQWRYQRTRERRSIAHQREIERRTETEDSAFDDHRLRWLEAAGFESEAVESDAEADGGDYNDEIGLVENCWSEEAEPREDSARSVTDHTESDDSDYEKRDVTITLDEVEGVSEALADSPDPRDESPVSARTRSRSISAVSPLRESARSLFGDRESTTLSPDRARSAYTRAGAQHSMFAPLNYKIPLRTKDARQRYAD